jgi:hypothetical protein
MRWDHLAPPTLDPIDMMYPAMTTETTPEVRRRNVRAAWLLAVLAAFMFLTSIPFWKGLANMIAATAR